VGSKEGVREAALQFVQRCRTVGATINELPSTNTTVEDEQQVSGLITQEGEWLGAEYDYQGSRQRLAKKTADKLAASWGARNTWTNRRYAAHMGLLFFATNVLRLRVASHFDALKGLRSRSQMLTADPERWDDPAHLGVAELAALARWTEESSANCYVPCVTGEKPKR
jgi:hypothetical protein